MQMPRLLRPLWAGWLQFARVLGVINRFILLSAFYFLMVNVVHVFLWLFRVDLLDRRMRPVASYWHERSQAGPKLHQHQF